MSKTMIVAAALLTATPALADTPATAPVETSIPFISSTGIIEWEADGSRGLYIRGVNNSWYYARMQGRCGRLVTANSLGFETSALDELDRHGAILAEGWRCPIASLVASAPPPRKKKRG